MPVNFSQKPLSAFIAPIVKGKPFMGGWRLAELTEGETQSSLLFKRDDGDELALLLYPPYADAAHWKAARAAKFAFGGRARPSEAAKTLALAVAAIFERNEARLCGTPWKALIPARADIPKNEQTVLLISRRCQNRCVFCTDARLPIAEISTDEAKRELESLLRKGFKSVTFSAMEPTLREDLPNLARFSREAGFKEVKVISNGARLCEPDYALELIEAGLDRITLSVHSGDEAVEAAITRNKRAFDQKRRALENLSAILRVRKEAGPRGPQLFTNTVICNYNLGGLDAAARFLSQYELDAMDFFFVYPYGAAAESFEDVVPTLTAMREPLERLLAEAEKIPVPVLMHDLPLCAAPARMRAQFRDYCVSHSKAEPEGAELEETATAWSEERVKAPVCAGCAADEACGGLWKEYAERRGTSELRPLTEKQQ